MESVENTVLVIDDDRAVREAIVETLELAGMSVLTAEDGEQGLDVLSKHRPAVILLDIRMPIMDGWEFRKAQLENPAYANIPVFVLSAGKPEGINPVGFLEKPVDADQILASVSRFLRREERHGIELPAALGTR